MSEGRVSTEFSIRYVPSKRFTAEYLSRYLIEGDRDAVKQEAGKIMAALGFEPDLSCDVQAVDDADKSEVLHVYASQDVVDDSYRVEFIISKGFRR